MNQFLDRFNGTHTLIILNDEGDFGIAKDS